MKPPFIPETNFSCPNASGFGRINTFGRVLSIQRDFAPDLCDFHTSSLTVVKKNSTLLTTTATIDFKVYMYFRDAGKPGTLRNGTERNRKHRRLQSCVAVAQPGHWYWPGTSSTLNHCANNTSACTHMNKTNFGWARARPGPAFATPLLYGHRARLDYAVFDAQLRTRILSLYYTRVSTQILYRGSRGIPHVFASGPHDMSTHDSK